MTYKQLYDQALQDAKTGSQVSVAQLIAVTQAMQAQGPDAQVDQAQIVSDTTNIMRRNGFRQAIKDDDAKGMWENGKAQQLVDLYKDYDNPNQTYRKYMRVCKQNAKNLQEPDAMLAANMVSAAMLMQSVGPGAEVDMNDLSQMSLQLMKQSSFRAMVKDPKTLQLMKDGKGVGMVELMAQKQNEYIHRNDDYRRIESQVKDDAKILSDYLNNVGGTADAGAINVTRKGKAYREMIQQMQSAQTKMAQGIPLSGDESKALCDAVQKYNNNNQNIAGGMSAKNVHYAQNMSLLKRFMPPKEFNAYCADIKKAHPQRESTPENFIPGRLNGTAKTAAELKAEYKRSLQHSFSLEGVAAICAINKMAKGDKNCVITQDRLKFETKKMMAQGSAFNRTVMNAPDKKVLKDLSEQGNVDGVIKEVQERSVKHTVGTAQWYVNRSARALNDGHLNRHEAAFNLAALVAAGSVAKDAMNLSTPIDKKAFSSAIEATMASKDFQRMVDRYQSDPSYRKNLNANIATTGGANVSQELYKYEHEVYNRPKQAEQSQAQVQPK